MDLSNYYELRALSDLAVSPDGERVAFTATEYDEVEDDPVSGLFVAPADGSREPHRLTRASGAGSPAWSPDGERLAFTATRDRDAGLRTERADDEAEDGEESEDEPESQVWVFDLALGGDARQVTTREHGVREFDWAPDGERIVVAARDPTSEQEAYVEGLEEGEPIETTRLQHKQDGMGWLDDVRTYLFVVDVDSREETRLDDAYGTATGTDGTPLSPDWGASGRIAFLSKRERRPDDQKAVGLYTIAPDGTGVRRVTGDEVSASAPAWSPDGERLAFVGGNPTDWYAPPEVYVTGEDGYESRTPDLDRPVARYAGLSWPDDETVVTAFGDEGRTRVARVDATDGGASWTFDAQGDFESVRHLDAAGGTVGLSISHPAEGHDAYAFDESALEAGEPTRLSHLNRPLTREQPAPNCADVEWENANGDALHGYLYTPQDYEGDEELPLVTAIHGGPVAYDDPTFSFDILHWTSRGYAVFRPNYRGSSSYGYEFSAAIAGDWGPRETRDVVSGVDHLVAEGVADDDRLFVTGFSYGGITTGYLVAETDMFAAGAAEHGVYDYRSAFGTDDCQNWWEADFGLPWEEQEQYAASSSIRDVDEMETPLLITAGDEDWRCPPTQSEQLYVSLQKRDVPSKLVVYQGEHHSIGDPDRAVHRLEAIDAWFDEYDPAK